MSASISISIDAKRRLMVLRLGGFFQPSDVAQFDTERRQAFANLGCGMNQHLTLCDVSDCALSTPAVVAALQHVIGNPLYRSKRCAMVVPGALAKLQARRAVQRADVAMFDTYAEAEAWLMAEEATEQSRAVNPASRR